MSDSSIGTIGVQCSFPLWAPGITNHSNSRSLTIALQFTGWSCSIDTVHSKYCNTELHTSRKCYCSFGVTSGDVGVDTVIRGVDDSGHILHCTVTHTPANQ